MNQPIDGQDGAGDRQFGRYQVTGWLGRGGFAEVFSARDPLLRRDVALKVLLPHHAADADLRRRFLAEARALARLRHPHIVGVYDIGEADGAPFFTMELIAGETLASLLAVGWRLDDGRIMSLLRDVASALDALHAAGLVHRDVKPANVLVDGAGRAVLMDLGLSEETTAPPPRDGAADSVLGTPAVMAPEQIRGEAAGPAADIYALGVLAYHLFAGQPPFAGDVPHLLYAHTHLPPPPLHRFRPDLSVTAVRAVSRALAKAPGERPASAGAFVDALEGGGGGGGGDASAAAAGEASITHAITRRVARYAPLPPTRTGAAARTRANPADRFGMPRSLNLWRHAAVVALGLILVLGAVLTVAARAQSIRRGAPTTARAVTTTPAPTASTTRSPTSTTAAPASAPRVSATPSPVRPSPTPTPRASASATAGPAPAPSAPSSSLRVGATARLSTSRSCAALRTRPAEDAAVIACRDDGEQARIIDGPWRAEGGAWWKVRPLRTPAVEGWIAAASLVLDADCERGAASPCPALPLAPTPAAAGRR